MLEDESIHFQYRVTYSGRPVILLIDRDAVTTRGGHVNPDTRARRIEMFVGDKIGRREVQERVSQGGGRWSWGGKAQKFTDFTGNL